MQKPMPGDFVFFPQIGSFWDFWIRFVSPNYTHIGIYVNDTTIIDANLWTVELRPFEHRTGATIKRVKGTSEEQGRAIMTYALAQAGEPYSMFGAAWAGLLSIFNLSGPTDDSSNNWHCAKLATKCIREVLHIDPFPGKSSMSVFPDMLYNWNGFETIKVY